MITKHITILNNTTLVIGPPKSYQLIISNIKNVINNDNIATPIINKIFLHDLLTPFQQPKIYLLYFINDFI